MDAPQRAPAPTRPESTHRQDFLQLLVIFHQQDVHLGMFDDVLAGLGRVGDINANAEAPGDSRHTQVWTDSAFGRIHS